jgi:hypothetical protein
MHPPEFSTPEIARCVTWLHDRPVLLQTDVARLYGLSVERLRALVQAHIECFPGELCFVPEPGELVRQHLAAESPVDAFTATGALMVATLIKSRPALTQGVAIARAFDRCRTPGTTAYNSRSNQINGVPL